MVHCCKYMRKIEETFVFASNSNQHICRGKKVKHKLRLVPETVTSCKSNFKLKMDGRKIYYSWRSPYLVSVKHFLVIVFENIDKLLFDLKRNIIDNLVRFPMPLQRYRGTYTSHVAEIIIVQICQEKLFLF